MFPLTYVAALLSLLIVVVLALIRRAPQLPPEEFNNFLSNKPTLWMIVDTETNARSWLDFGSRNTTEPNRGYLQVAIAAARRTQGDDYNIKPLIGRDAVLAEIPNAQRDAVHLPPALWRRWAIANLCAARGGLAVDANSTLFVGPRIAPRLAGVQAAVFGISPDEPVASPTTAYAPGPAPYVGWSAAPNHPAWTYAAAIWNKLVAAGAQAWTSAEARRTYMTVFEAQRERGIETIRDVECCRNGDGTARQLEDIFGRSSLSDTKTALPSSAVYISYDGDDLARRYEFAWFLRLSPEQIAKSEIAWARYAGVA
jgi:hypothetical protein